MGLLWLQLPPPESAATPTMSVDRASRPVRVASGGAVLPALPSACGPGFATEFWRRLLGCCSPSGWTLEGRPLPALSAVAGLAFFSTRRPLGVGDCLRCACCNLLDFLTPGVPLTPTAPTETPFRDRVAPDRVRPFIALTHCADPNFVSCWPPLRDKGT